MTELDIIKVKRVRDKKEARSSKGETVPDLDANVIKAGIYVDEETNEPFLVYIPMDENDVSKLRHAVRNIKYSSSGVTRQSSGIENHSRTFGMSPRKPFQTREACRPTALSYEQPDEHGVLAYLRFVVRIENQQHKERGGRKEDDKQEHPCE